MKTITPLIEQTKIASAILKDIEIPVLNAILHDMADALIENQDVIVNLNKQDVKNGNAMMLSSLAMDRLLLNNDRISALTTFIRELASNQSKLRFYSPEGKSIDSPSTLAIIYESRPYLTAKAACFAFRTGNAIVLRGGREAFHTNTAIASILCDVLEQNGLPRELITLIPTSDRVSMTELIGLKDLVDYLIPKGSEGLMSYLFKYSQVPVITGISALDQ